MVGLCEKHCSFKYRPAIIISSHLLPYRITAVFGLPVIRIEPESMYKQCCVVFLKHAEDDKSFLRPGEWEVSLSLTCFWHLADGNTLGQGHHLIQWERKDQRSRLRPCELAHIRQYPSPVRWSARRLSCLSASAESVGKTA